MVDIDSFLNQFNDFDIRITHDARYVDQKCTPDIVCFISDCILSTSCATKTFTVNDLWDECYFVNNCRIIFGKPSPTDQSAYNEYNKVLCQPLKLLSYAHVLDVSYKNRALNFRVANLEMLEYIATKERNAYNFMIKYFMKVITDSGIMRFFDEYRESCKTATEANLETRAKMAKEEIYKKYHLFISSNTPSKSKTDVDRMFHKVFNLYAYYYMLPGNKGKTLNWYDLMYNKVNWRDIGYKQKNQTRSQARLNQYKIINQNYYIDYQVEKAIRKVKQIQGDISEVHDELAQGRANEVHHIFPKSEFPELGSYFENLILLTSSQHRQKAHTNSNFHIINREYQLVCLMAKSVSVENYIRNYGESFYSKKAFIFVVNTGTSRNELSEEDSFDTIRRYIHNLYNNVDDFSYQNVSKDLKPDMVADTDRAKYELK